MQSYHSIQKEIILEREKFTTGNSGSTSDCGSATCSYAGFSSNHIIFTSLDDTCPSSPSAAPSAALSKSHKLYIDRSFGKKKL
ncbi:hypothetical protein LINGRAHAP2_LOCUS22854 [Linum grandiflorum]